MLRSLTCIALALATASAFAGPAESGSRKYAPATSAPREGLHALSTAAGAITAIRGARTAEQALWDRAEARRLGR